MNHKPTPLKWQVILSPHVPPRYPPPGSEGTLRFSPLDLKEDGRIRGLTPHPTPTDGWYITGRIKPTKHGLIINRFVIEPSRMVWEDGQWRKRTKDEKDIDITSSVLRLIDLTDIRNEYRREVEALAEAANVQAHPTEDQWGQVVERVSKQRRKRTVNTPENMYLFSQDVLREIQAGPGIRARLANQWCVSINTAKSRVLRLRSEEWIAGDVTNAIAGPTYMRYEAKLKTDNSKEQT